jgi:AcrR family transcriptional regulator
MTTDDRPNQALSDRILKAAFEAFQAKGYAGTTTREVAARAQVSKRDLYALFEDKQAMLAACIASRAGRVASALALPEVTSRPGLAKALREYGATFLRELSHPNVVALYQLGVLEAGRSPQVARALYTHGREATRKAFAEMLRGAQAAGFLGRGDPATMATQFFSLLWGDRMLNLLLRVERAPSPQEAAERARMATDALLALYPS